MKHLRYTGEFLSYAGTVWRCEIWQEADAEFSRIGILEFDLPALVIEWKREDKENVICGSTATLKINSPGDRTYEDLYTIKPGNIRLDVYRDNALYWSGALDPEFYEEPYEKAKDYTVQLTFSDFGILDRLNYELSGMRTLREIILYAMRQSGILYGGLDTTYITTTVPGSGNVLSESNGLSIRSENFYDEDGKAETLKKTLEGILQPLAVRMIQRAGKIYLYDLHGLYNYAAAKAIAWDGATQTMSTDKVANNVVVSFSPYSSSELLKGELEYGGKYDVNHTNLTSDWPSAPAEYGEYYSYYPDYSEDNRVGSNWDYNLIDFTIFLYTQAKGLANIGGGCKYFKILPITGGASECEGVAYAFRTGGHGALTTGWPKWKVHNGVPHCGNTVIMRTNRVFLPALDSDTAKKYRVRLVEEMLCDCRYNPFSSSTDGNESGNDDGLKVWSGFVFIPASATIYDAAGNALYHYRNKDTVLNGTTGHIGYTNGRWVAGADPGGDFYLEYYNPDDLKEDAGVRGWKGNRQCIGRPDGKAGRPSLKMYKSFAKMDDGEYLPYPPVAGYLEIEIKNGINGYDYGESCAFDSNESIWDRKGVYGKLRWLLYKAPKVDVVNYNLVFDKAELEDVEYSGYINREAKEEISIDTICGTAATVCPTAKGIYSKTSNGQQIQTLTRAGRTDHPEKLLIGTIYSQYADRKTTLRGEALIDGGLHYYTEQNQGNKRFILMEDVQDVITDCTEAEYCEFRPDEYDSIEEVN